MAPSMVELTTDRLRLRPRIRDDLEACIAMDLDPQVGRYLNPFGPPTEFERRSALEKQMAGDWPPLGGVWAVERRDNPTFLGWCGLFPLEDSGLIEIGYRYNVTAWGQGIATEAATRVMEFGFGDLGIDPIVAVTHPENTASQNVLAKLGMTPRGLRRHYGLDLAFYELSCADYSAGSSLRDE
jgi:RimJ/RimL family protein N-acetyltransferase